jgi:hypothetical protein
MKVAASQSPGFARGDDHGSELRENRGTYHPQHMHTESHTNNFDVSSDMDVTTNEVDKEIDGSAFT